VAQLHSRGGAVVHQHEDHVVGEVKSLLTSK
jgi:hypothetical protein